MADNVRRMPPQPKPFSTPNEFVVPLKNDKEKSGDMHFRIHPGFIREATEMYKPGQERGAPWKTQDDCDRWIWKCGLKAAAEILKVQPVGATTAFDLFMKETVLELEAVQARDNINRIRDLIERRRSIGMKDESLQQYIRDGWRAINAIKYPHWRDYLLREFEREFGYMMKNAGLNPLDFEKDD